MKKTFKLLVFTLLAFGMMACSGKKVTQDDLKEAEAALFNDDMSTNPEAEATAVETFVKYAEQNPDDAAAPNWLFKAMEISVRQKDSKKSIEICDKLMKDFPSHEKTPMGMFMLASLVYDDQLHDLDKARAMYERILSDYPESEIAPSAEASLPFLGMTPDEIIRQFETADAEITEE